MHKTLIIKAFEEAKAARRKKGEKNPSLQALAEDISEFGSDTKKFVLGERRLRDYYSQAKTLENNKGDIDISQFDVIKGLCEYLGFKNYEQFVASLSIKDKSLGPKLTILIKKNRITITIFTIAIVTIIAIASINGQRWMIWQEDHYVEVEFDQDKMRQGLLKIYKEDRIQHFKKIVPDCSTAFFKKDGSENLWYGKNEDGELEYFTDLAQHPETGKSLDPMTKYMIRKYVCESYR